MNNRIIKFRFWTKTDGIMSGMLSLQRIAISGFSDKSVFNPNRDDVEIMQFTGLLDCSGKEIYEGDIVEVRDSGFGYKYIGVINWDQQTLSYQLGISKDYPTMSAGLRDIIRTLNYHTFEVIGNLYENPELLEEEKLNE